MLGWKEGTWAYHSENGGFYNEWGFPRHVSGKTYGAGNTIGCGINFETGTAFFTRDGEVLGMCFSLTSSLSLCCTPFMIVPGTDWWGDDSGSYQNKPLVTSRGNCILLSASTYG